MDSVPHTVSRPLIEVINSIPGPIKYIRTMDHTQKDCSNRVVTPQTS